jgi:NADP-dependent 3-hydroxy acid dehydrogenase YdfG
MIDTKTVVQKTVLITGCGKNSLGSAVALKFARSGFRVVATNLILTDMTELDNIPNLVKYEMDVTNAVQVNQVIGEIKQKVGDIDMVINSAGVYYSDFILNADEGILDMLFNVNFKGTFNVCKVVVPMMVSLISYIYTLY